MGRDRNGTDKTEENSYSILMETQSYENARNTEECAKTDDCALTEDCAMTDGGKNAYRRTDGNATKSSKNWAMTDCEENADETLVGTLQWLMVRTALMDTLYL